MIIRPAEVGDAEAIADFIAMAEGEMVTFLTGQSDAGKMDAAKAILLDWVKSPVPNRYSLDNNIVAEVDGAAAGSIVSFPADLQPQLDSLILEAVRRRGLDLDSLYFEGAPGTYYLSTMGVNPEMRGKGVGTALLAAASEKARSLGYAATSLLVSKHKPRAQALYERVGFVTTGGIVMGGHEYNRMERAV